MQYQFIVWHLFSPAPVVKNDLLFLSHTKSGNEPWWDCSVSPRLSTRTGTKALTQSVFCDTSVVFWFIFCEVNFCKNRFLKATPPKWQHNATYEITSIEKQNFVLNGKTLDSKSRPLTIVFINIAVAPFTKNQKHQDLLSCMQTTEAAYLYCPFLDNWYDTDGIFYCSFIATFTLYGSGCLTFRFIYWFRGNTTKFCQSSVNI